jgi:hypothetical protein
VIERTEGNEQMATIVKVLRIEEDGTEVFERYSELRDCFPEDDIGYEEAYYEIGQVGRFWVGGGAAPLFLLIRP